MKKITLSLATIGAALLPIVAFADDANPITETKSPAIGSIGDLTTMIHTIENFIWIIFGGLAVIMFVVAGIQFLTAQGEPEKVQTARSSFIWGIAGVAVAIIAYSIIAIVSSVVR